MFTSGIRFLLRGRASPAVSATAIVALLLFSMLVAGVAAGLPARPSASSPLASATASPPASAATPVGATHVTPAGQGQVGVFYENNSHFADLPANQTPCQSAWRNTSSVFSSPPYTYYDNYDDFFQSCYAGAQTPSTLSLGGNTIGTGYSVLSNRSMVGCSNSPDVETSQVAFARSTDAGQNYATPVWIGNTSCAYLNALEPSFTHSSNGKIYGAFVEANYGNATNTTMPFAYANRTNDSLAFTTSSNLGVSFSAAKTLSISGIGNIARPEIAAFGSSVYIVYENLDNNSSIFLPTNYPYPSPNPIALELIDSTNGGGTWHGPYTLPGLNASSGYSSMSPSIAVNSLGEIAVAYATNRSCFNGGFGYCNEYGDSIVASTSLTNGTSWTGPVAVSPNATGEYECAGWSNQTFPNYYRYCYTYMFQWEPAVSVAWSDVNSSDLYVAWAGGYSFFNASDFSNFIGYSAVFSAASQDGGSTWNDSIVAAQLNPSYLGTTDYTPVIGVRAGWVYVSYAQYNDSYCFSGCVPGNTGYSFWLSTSTDGTTWLQNRTLLLWNPLTFVQDAFVGYTESMGFSLGGPVVTFSDPVSYTETFFGYGNSSVNGTNYYFYDHEWENGTGLAALTTAFVWAGNTTAVNFTETGLPPGTPWGFSLGSAAFSSTSPTIRVANVPTGPGLAISVPFIADGFWTRFAGTPSTNASPVFNSTSGNVTIAFVIQYGISFAFSPTTDPLFDLHFQVGTVFYELYSYGCGPSCQFVDPTPFPWWFTTGTVLAITSADLASAWPISFWSGTGNGSSTVYGIAVTITVNGVINETAFAGAYGAYSISFEPAGLPGGTNYQFTFNGTTYTATSPATVAVANVPTGAYAVSGIQANGTAGYEYFGEVTGGDEIYVPATIVVELNYSYAYVDLSAAPGTVTFQAAGLAVGDPWQMSLNGTTYSSSTPWINITTRPGTYGVSANPVPASVNDTAQYAATGFGPTQTVLTGSTYSVMYSPIYRVQAYASAGGGFTGAATQWLAPGTPTSFTAHANLNYVFLGWTGSGSGSYSGLSLVANVTANGPITETASFQALPVDRFNLTFTQTGLPSGVTWTVNLDGNGYSSTGSTLIIPNLYPCTSGATGTYTVGVPLSYLNGTSGVRYVPSGAPATICTTGTTQVALTFGEEFLVTPVSTGGGSAAVEVNGVSQATAAWAAAGTTVGIEASPEAGYAFAGWVGQGVGNYTGPLLNDELTPTGPLTEVATFTLIVPPPAPRYWVDFHAAAGLPAGTAWSLDFNSTLYSSSTSWINLTGYLTGTYPLSVPSAFSSDHLTEFIPAGVTSSLLVSQNLSNEQVSFASSYWVSVSATAGGSLVGAVNGFIGSGKTVTLNATPNAGYALVGWTGNGSGAYTGTLASTSIVVNGPVSEVASFALIPPAATTSSGLGSNSTPIIVGLAVVGLLIGLGAGYVIFRRRSAPGGGAS